MESEFIRSAREELKQLDADYQQKRFESERIARRMGAIRTLLDAYETDGHASISLTAPVPIISVTATVVPRENSFKARALAEAEEVLELFGQMKTEQLVKALQASGITFTAQDPVAALSSLLSKHKEKFVADRKNGWSLAKESPQDVAASAGLDTKAVSTEPPGEAPTHRE